MNPIKSNGVNQHSPVQQKNFDDKPKTKENQVNSIFNQADGDKDGVVTEEEQVDLFAKALHVGVDKIKAALSGINIILDDIKAEDEKAVNTISNNLEEVDKEIQLMNDKESAKKDFDKAQQENEVNDLKQNAKEMPKFGL